MNGTVEMNGTAKSARRLLIATAILILLVCAAIVWAPESSRDDAVPWIVAAFLGTLIALESLWRGVTLRRLLIATTVFALLFGTLAIINS